MTLALGFGGATSGGGDAARRSLAGGFRAAASAYAQGWHAYLGRLKPAPRRARTPRPTTCRP